jgi:transcriptional antiterminator RfaH
MNNTTPIATGASEDKRWYLVYTKPRQEQLARDNLERQGYMTYLPQVRNIRRRQGTRRYADEPFFPRYMFINLNTLTDDWSPIRSTVGVASLVRFGAWPTPVPDTLIHLIRERENPETGLHEVEQPLRQGDKVCIMDGPMAGFEGIFLAPSGQERVLVLLEIMGKQARLQVDADALKRGGY